MRPTGPTALVTGASRGIGRATVERLLESGWRVAAGVRDPHAARAALPDHPDLGIIRLDVSRPDEIADGVAAAEEHAGGALCAVVNNAGWALLGAVEDVDLAHARAMFETNLFGAAAVIQAALPEMRVAGRGVVVNVSSIGGRITNPLLGIYHASKYALTALSEALAMEVAPFGLRVVLIEPGMVATEFPKATMPTGALTERAGPYVPLLDELRPGFGRWRDRHAVSAEDVARAIDLAIADEECPFRVEVGDDARWLADTRRRLDDRAFHGELLGFLSISRWPDGDGG